MKRPTRILVAAALVWTPTAQAATDPGLMLHDTQSSGHRVGAGVQATVSIPLGRASDDTRTTRLSLRAGPAMTRVESNTGIPIRSRIAPLTELAVRSNHSTVWSLAGQPLAASYTPQALRERRDGMTDGPHNNISTLGIVAIGVGVAVVVGGVVLRNWIRESNRRD